MDLENNTVQVDTQVVDSAPATAPESTVTSESTAAPAEWTPNYKVKAYDAEYEIPETFRGYINKDNEADFRKIFEKAYGLEVMSSKNGKLRETNAEYEKRIKEQYEPLDRGVKQVSKYLEAKDYDSFFATLKIEQKDLEKWMLQKLQLKDLPPEQQELYSRSSEAQKRAYELERQAEEYRTKLETYESQQFEAATTQRTNELEQVLSRPEIKAIVERFDSRKNQPGAFRDEVIRRAEYVFQTQKKDLSAEEAVKELAELMMFDSSPQAQPHASQQPQNPNNTVLAPRNAAAKPTLPSLAGKTSSPAAQKVKTMDDLIRLKKAVEAQNRN